MVRSIMSYKIDFWDEAKEAIEKWKKSNRKSFDKLTRILREIAIHPKMGTGHPEPLKGGGGIIYSRRISAHDRIIYKIYEEEDTVYVIKVEGHYDDK